MAERIGITTDLEVCKFQLESEFKNTRNWRSTPAFETKDEALQWEDAKSKELKCKTVKSKDKGKGARTNWFGYYFEHDGPR